MSKWLQLVTLTLFSFSLKCLFLLRSFRTMFVSVFLNIYFCLQQKGIFFIWFLLSFKTYLMSSQGLKEQKRGFSFDGNGGYALGIKSLLSLTFKSAKKLSWINVCLKRTVCQMKIYVLLFSFSISSFLFLSLSFFSSLISFFLSFLPSLIFSCLCNSDNAAMDWRIVVCGKGWRSCCDELCDEFNFSFFVELDFTLEVGCV